MNIYLDLFFSFFKIGLFTIGGGMAIIPLIANLTISKGWIERSMLYDFIAVAESTPGAFAVNVATYVGYHMGGILGAFIAVLAIALPSFIIILIIFKVSTKLFDNPIVNSAFSSLKAGVVGLIGSAMVVIAYNSFYSDTMTGVLAINWAGIVLTVLIFVLYKKFNKIPPIALIVIAGVLGMGVYTVLY